MTLITVALVGNQDGPGSRFPADEEWSKPWSKRRHVTVEVSPAATYGEIIETALYEFFGGVTKGYRPYSISFWQTSDDAGRLGRATYVLAVINPDGTATWKPWHEVTVSEALDAHSRGLLPGDPARPYAFVLPQVGNGTLPIWAELSHMLDLLRQVAELLELPGGVAATYWLLRDRPKKAEEAVARHGEDWHQRGLDPYLFDQWLDNHSWRVEQIAGALACTPEEASAVLWALGFTEDSDGLWRRAVDPESATMSGIRTLLISTASRFADDPQLAKELRRRLEHLLETGEAPPERDWDRLPWLQPKVPGTEAMQSRSRRAFNAMLKRLGKTAE